MSEWVCPACTYANEAHQHRCELCDTAKGGASGSGSVKPGHAQVQQQDVMVLDSDEEQTHEEPAPKRQRKAPAADAAAGPSTATPAPAAEDDAGPSASPTEPYVLDTCGCKHGRQQLRTRLLQQLQAEGGVLSTLSSDGPTLEAAVANVCCPDCTKELSHQDCYNLLGGSIIGKVYAALFAKAKHELGPLPPESDPRLPRCEACSTAMLSTDTLAATGTPAAGDSSAQQQQAPASMAVLKAALKARGLSRQGAKAVLAQRLQESVGEAAYFCTSCPATHTPAAAAAGAEAALPQAGAESALQLCRSVLRLHAVLTDTAGGAGAGPSGSGRGGGSSGKHSGRGGHSGGRGRGGAAWAKGTGYSGSSSLSKADTAAMAAAGNRQAQTDERCQALLASICIHLRERSSQALPLGECAVLLAGPLAFVLRLLLQNDSLLDIGCRKGLYNEVLQLLRLVGARTDLVPLLQLRAVAPDDDDNDETDGQPSRYTLLAVLSRLDQQCSIFKKSAEQLADGDDSEDIQAIGLALEISELCESLTEAAAMFSASIGASAGPLLLPSSKPAKPSTVTATAAPAGPSRRWRGSGAAAAATASADAAAAAEKAVAAEKAAAERRYCEALRPYLFTQASLLAGNDYFFRSAAAASTSAGGEAMRKRLRRITEEMGVLSTSLPLSFDSSILLAVDEERLDVLRACFFPAPDTPYACGAFIFDILLPPNYPDVPPSVHFLTTGNATVRFNPNLYNCGKVCLSLLGTWAGPSWQPGVSTLLQVLISLQSMVFVGDPYFNEPGFEGTMQTPAGREASRAYNENLRAATMRFAILAPLRTPTKAFEAATRAHFAAKAPVVEALCEQWVRECKAANTKSAMQGLASDIKKELRKLVPKSPAAEASALAATATQAAQQQREQRERQEGREEKQREEQEQQRLRQQREEQERQQRREKKQQRQKKQPDVVDLT